MIIGMLYSGYLYTIVHFRFQSYFVCCVGRIFVLLFALLCHFVLLAQLSVSPNQITQCSDADVTITAHLQQTNGGFLQPENESQDPYDSLPLPIGFGFTFFGVSYDSLLLSENGFLTFNIDSALGTTSAANYLFAQMLGQHHNTIAFPFQDLIIKNNTVDNVNTMVLGEDGERLFLLEYCEIELDKCPHLTSSSQVVLHEGSNIIDIHILNKPSGCNFNGGTGILGITGPNGETFLIPGMDVGNTSWGMSGVSYRFTPQPDGTYTWEIIPFSPMLIDFHPQYSNISWSAGSNPNTVLGTGQTFDISTPNTEDYYLCTYQSQKGCLSDSLVIYQDTIWLSVKESDTTLHDTICQQNLPYHWQQHTINSVGNHSLQFDTISLVNACDSIVTMKLVVHPTKTVTDEKKACINNLPGNAWQYNENQAITAIGTYQYIDTTSSIVTGCDSVVTHILQVHDTVYQAITIDTCESALPWLWNGISINAAGTYTKILQTSQQCDSTVHLTVIVHPTLHVDLANTTICEVDLPYTWNEIAVQTVGTHELTHTTMSSFGCDSITQQKFTVIPTEIIDLPDSTICFEQLPFTWENNTITEVGTGEHLLSHTILSQNTDCYQTTNLKVNVLEKIKTISFDTLCESALPHTWNGQTINTTGDFSLQHIEPSLAHPLCDSTIEHNIHVHANIFVQIDSVICEQNIEHIPFEWNGHFIYYDSVTKVHRGNHQLNYTINSINTACDSTTTLLLNVDTTVIKDTTLFYCWKEKPSYWNAPSYWNGHKMYGSGTYVWVDTFPQVITGCDSIIRATITIDDPPPSTTHLTCESELPFVDDFSGQFVTSIGVYHTTEEEWISPQNCVDKHITTWAVVPYGAVHIKDTTLMCSPNFPITWRNKTLNDYQSYEDLIDYDGFMRDTVTNTIGDCSSIDVYRLWIEPPHVLELDTVICQSNMPFTWRKFSISNPPDGLILRDTLKQAVIPFEPEHLYNCDSIFICNVTVNPTVYTTVTHTICSSELPYEWNELSISEQDLTAGYIDTTITLQQVENDCDSVVTLQLSVNPTKTTELSTIEICYEELLPYIPHNWGTDYQITNTDVAENDTLIERIYTTPNHLGCDSTVTFHAIVHPKNASDTIVIGLCQALGFYTWKDTTIAQNEAETYIISRIEPSEVTNCDSIITAKIVINDAIIVTLPDSMICEKNLPFEWNDTIITADMGTGTYLLTADLKRDITQCDSTVRLNLHVNSALTTIADTVKICQENLPSSGYTWHEHIVTTVGTHDLVHHTVSEVTGCDSSITKVVVVYPTKTVEDHLHYCDSDLPFTWFDRTINATGSYDTTFYFQYVSHEDQDNPLMCDSIEHHFLFVGETRYASVSPQTICESDTASFSWRGQTIQATGTLYDTIPSSINCDSITSLNVTVIPTIVVQLPDSISCEEKLPFVWHGDFINSPGEYDLEYTVIVPPYGCPKVESIHFIGLEQAKAYTFDTLCETDLPYTYGTTTISQMPPFPHIRVVELHSPKHDTGCDSMTFIAVKVNPTPMYVFDSIICEDEIADFMWQGKTASDLDFQVLVDTVPLPNPDPNKFMCDSLTKLNLTVQRSPIIHKKDLVCYQVNEGEIEVIPPTGFGVFSFQWTEFPSYHANSIDHLPAGTYQVVVANQRCTTTHNVEIVQPNPLNITFPDNDVLCFEDYTGTITPQVEGGTEPYVYLWNDALSQTTQSATNLLPGNYTITVTDHHNCIQSASFELIQPPMLTLTLWADSVLCFGQNNGTAHVVATGGTPNYSYSWNSTPEQTTATADNLPIGTYTVTVTDNNNCQKTENITVFEPDSLALSFTKEDVVCFGENNGSANVEANGGTPNYSYSWNTSPQQTNAQAKDLFVGTYTVTVSDQNNCKTVDSIVIEQPEKLVLSVSNDTTICPYDFASLFGTYIGGVDPVSIDWGNGQNSWNIQAQPKQDSIYMPIITDAHQCQDSLPIKVRLVVLPRVDFTNKKIEGCPPVQIHFDNLSTGIYTDCTWELSNGLVFNQCGSLDCEINTIGYSDLTLTVYSQEGCRASETKNNIIYIEPWPIASFYTDKTELSTIHTEVKFTNTSILSTQYEWNFGDTSIISTLIHPTHLYPDSYGGEYKVLLTAKNNLGCIDTASTIITITGEELIYVPNAFTPDNNIFNEVFLPIISSTIGVDNYRLDIFDRWGEIIFTTHNVDQAWDGTYKGVLQQSGVYVWKISIRAKNTDETRVFIGMVTLLK